MLLVVWSLPKVSRSNRWSRRLLSIDCRVTTLDPDAPGSHPGPETPGIHGLGKILQDATGLVQLVYVEELVPAEILDALVREARA